MKNNHGGKMPFFLGNGIMRTNRNEIKNALCDIFPVAGSVCMLSHGINERFNIFRLNSWRHPSAAGKNDPCFIFQ